jgi:hypothetical protein
LSSAKKSNIWLPKKVGWGTFKKVIKTVGAVLAAFSVTKRTIFSVLSSKGLIMPNSLGQNLENHETSPKWSSIRHPAAV